MWPDRAAESVYLGMNLNRVMLFSVLLLVGALAHAKGQGEFISLDVDATDVARKLYHVDLSIPVKSGPLTLSYPKWLYNAPIGSVTRMVGLVFEADGKSLPWRRDLHDMFAFHLMIPAGARELRVKLDAVPATLADGFGAVSSKLMVLEWHQLVLYPAGSAADSLSVHARVRLPQGWDHACALKGVRREEVVDLPTVSLAELVDSPLIAGRYLNTFKLPAGTQPATEVHLAGESAASIQMPGEWQERITRLRSEAGDLFGEYPHPEYHFLISLSDELGNDGLEHRTSSDTRLGEHFFSDENYRLAFGYLIPHEYAHSWNGVSVKPRAEATRDFQADQTGELLWIYEGLTRYLNWELAARSGVLSLEESQEYLALVAARMDTRSGRRWRSLQDTADSAQFLLFAPTVWQSQRRDVDFYDESLLLWLEVDSKLRALSNGRRSLDDFLKAFFRPANRQAAVKIYELSDVTAALNRLAAADWADFFRQRLESTSPNAPMAGIVASGWALGYDNRFNSILSARDAVNHTIDERFSMGLLAQDDGTVLDVLSDSPAWQAGLGPGMKITAVDGHPWKEELFRGAVGRDNAVPLDLEVQNGSDQFKARVPKLRGSRYPHLLRTTGEDVIAEILRARTRYPE